MACPDTLIATAVDCYTRDNYFIGTRLTNYPVSFQTACQPDNATAQLYAIFITIVNFRHSRVCAYLRHIIIENTQQMTQS